MWKFVRRKGVEGREVGSGLLCQQRKRERGWNFNCYGKARLMMFCKTTVLSCKISRIYKLLWNADNASHASAVLSCHLLQVKNEYTNVVLLPVGNTAVTTSSSRRILKSVFADVICKIERELWLDFWLSRCLL
jgi:hypothetical protein